MEDSERKIQLFDLQAELRQALVEHQEQNRPPKLKDIRETLTDSQERVAISLFDPIELEEFAHNRDFLAPTPGDPEAVSSHGESYVSSVDAYIRKKFTKRTDRIHKHLQGLREGLDDFGPLQYTVMLTDIQRINNGLEEVMAEIYEGLKYNRTQNLRGMKRLRNEFLLHPDHFSESEAPLIRGVRSSEATDIDRIKLLAAHPEMDSSESMEFTTPLAPAEARKAVAAYIGRLENQFSQKDTPSDMKVVFFDANNQRVSLKDLDDNEGYGKSLSKTTLAEVTYRGVTMELQLKQRFYRFPNKLELPGVQKNLVQRKGEKIDLQIIGLSAYWRVKKEKPQYDIYYKEGMQTMDVN